MRGVLLLCAVVLCKAGAGESRRSAGVRDILRRAHRASSWWNASTVCCACNRPGTVRSTQGLLDLKRLPWNCHTFRTGRRKNTIALQRLGVPWPEGIRWWDVLKWSPEQLRDKLSTPKKAA